MEVPKAFVQAGLTLLADPNSPHRYCLHTFGARSKYGLCTWIPREWDLSFPNFEQFSEAALVPRLKSAGQYC